MEVEVEAGAGYDDNPLRVQEGVDAPDGGYTRLHLIADYEVEGARLDWSPRFHGDADLFGSSLDRADTWEALFDLPLEWVVRQRGVRKLVLGISPFYEESRRTFTRRASGEEFFDAGNQVSLGDRFDSRSYGATLDVRYQWRARTHVDLEVEARRRNYEEDFEGFALIDSLDYDSLIVRPWASYAFTRGLSAGVEGKYRRKDYDEKIPFFSDGSEALVLVGTEIVPVEPQEHRYYGYGTWLRYEKGRHRLKARYRRTRREDRFEGYLDRTDGSWSLQWDVAASKRLELAFDLDYERVRYPHARVFFDPANSLRLDSERFASVEARVLLAPGWRLILNASRDEADSRTSIFNYDRSRLAASIQYRFERSPSAAGEDRRSASSGVLYSSKRHPGYRRSPRSEGGGMRAGDPEGAT